MKPVRWLRDPLVHFLAIGALLFGVLHWRGGGAQSNRIVITPGQIDAIIAGFTRTWQRPPTEPELKAQLDEYVREEIAAREAMAMGLDRDDTIIRRRLRQKLEFLVEDTIDAAPPTDADLQAWLDAHPETFRIEPEIALRQVFVRPDRHGAALEGDVRQLLAQLAAAGASAALDAFGDPSLLPREVERTPRSEVARLFGNEFADAVFGVEPGRWVGPVRSEYGLHLVWVSEREDGRMPTLAEVRPVVEREFLAARRKRELDAMYTRLLGRYRLTLEKRPVDGAPDTSTGGSR